MSPVEQATVTAVLTNGKVVSDTLDITFTPNPPPPVAVADVLRGWSMSDNPHPGECGVTRIYDVTATTKVNGKNVNAIDQAVNVHKVKRITLTSQDDTKNPATVVSRIKSVLARHPNLEIDYAHENEVDREDHRGGSDADIKAWCAEHKAIQDAIHKEFPADGSKGKVKTAFDGTSWSNREGRTIKFMNELKRIGALPDVLGASWYPAGRKKTPPIESPMADHIDLWFEMAAGFGIKFVSCWEIGTPISINYDRAGLVTKWVKRGRDMANVTGTVFRDFIWWDQNIGIDNRLAADGSTTTAQGRTQKALLAA